MSTLITNLILHINGTKKYWTYTLTHTLTHILTHTRWHTHTQSYTHSRPINYLHSDSLNYSQNHKQLHTFTHNIQTMLHMHTQWHIYKRKLYVKKTKAGRCYAKTVKELDVNQNISENAIIVIL